MNKILSCLVCLLMLWSCKDGDSNQRILSQSSGNINNLSVVVDNLMWQNRVGEKLREVFAAPVEGLSIDEPLFSLRQLPPQAFSDFTTKSRTILIIDEGEPGTAIKRNVYAKPQTVVLVSGKNSTEIIQQIEENKDKIIRAIRKEELREKQRRIKMSLFDTNEIQENMGITLNFPTAYRIAKSEDDFYWIRKDINSGTMDLMIYEVPLSKIREGDSAVVDIVKMRDSIGEAQIQGRLEGAHMITEKGYAPYKFNETLDGKPVIVTKGLWDMKNDFMSGPFINYAIKDDQNERYVVLEGYVFAPSVEKRDNVFELESIIKSVKFE